MLIGTRSRLSTQPGGQWGPPAPRTLSGADLPASITGPDGMASLPDFGRRVLNEHTGEAGFETTGLTGHLQRLGDFFKSDQGRAALLRSGAATLQGGLGAGIAAGAGYVDHEKEQAAHQQQQDIENALATGRLDLDKLSEQQRNDLGWAGVDVNLRQLGEVTRHNRAGEGLQVRDQNVTMRGQDTQKAMADDRNATDITTTGMTTATSRANNDASVGASIYGSNLDYLGRGTTPGAGIGRGAQTYTETRVETPAVPATNPWLGTPTLAQPKTTTITRAPVNAGPTPTGTATPPPEAIAALKANPNLRGQFEAKYGVGSGSQYLGGR